MAAVSSSSPVASLSADISMNRTQETAQLMVAYLKSDKPDEAEKLALKMCKESAGFQANFIEALRNCENLTKLPHGLYGMNCMHLAIEKAPHAAIWALRAAPEPLGVPPRLGLDESYLHFAIRTQQKEVVEEILWLKPSAAKFKSWLFKHLPLYYAVTGNSDCCLSDKVDSNKNYIPILISVFNACRAAKKTSQRILPNLLSEEPGRMKTIRAPIPGKTHATAVELAAAGRYCPYLPLEAQAKYDEAYEILTSLDFDKTIKPFVLGLTVAGTNAPRNSPMQRLARNPLFERRLIRLIADFASDSAP